MEGGKLTLLADAMVLIDLGYVSGLDVLPKIDVTEVLDIVLEECRHHKQPTLVKDIGAAGIVKVPATLDLLKRAQRHKTAELSLQDCANLEYARESGSILLTNEKVLRCKCGELGITVHGTVWIMERALELKLRTAEQIYRWLLAFNHYNRWIPKDEIRRISNRLSSHQ